MTIYQGNEYHVTACVEHLCYILFSMYAFKMYVDIFYHMDHVSEINDLSYLILYQIYIIITLLLYVSV